MKKEKNQKQATFFKKKIETKIKIAYFGVFTDNKLMLISPLLVLIIQNKTHFKIFKLR